LKEVSYLGHRISTEGLKVDPKKIEAITEMHAPIDRQHKQLGDHLVSHCTTVFLSGSNYFSTGVDINTSLIFSRHFHGRSCPTCTDWSCFGISPVPEEFQRRMTEALEGLDGVKVIHDDILLYAVGDSDDEVGIDHDKKLRALLSNSY
jgi:hypothetical protein